MADRLAVPRSDFRVPTFYVHRAPLPLRLLVSRRIFSARAARAHGVAARLHRGSAHRTQRTLRLDGVRARTEAARTPGDHRLLGDAARRCTRDAARRAA